LKKNAKHDTHTKKYLPPNHTHLAHAYTSKIQHHGGQFFTFRAITFSIKIEEEGEASRTAVVVLEGEKCMTDIAWPE
jgi:hypothetical protein